MNKRQAFRRAAVPVLGLVFLETVCVFAAADQIPAPPNPAAAAEELAAWQTAAQDVWDGAAENTENAPAPGDDSAVENGKEVPKETDAAEVNTLPAGGETEPNSTGTETETVGAGTETVTAGAGTETEAAGGQVESEAVPPRAENMAADAGTETAPESPESESGTEELNAAAGEDNQGTSEITTATAAETGNTDSGVETAPAGGETGSETGTDSEFYIDTPVEDDDVGEDEEIGLTWKEEDGGRAADTDDGTIHEPSIGSDKTPSAPKDMWDDSLDEETTDAPEDLTDADELPTDLIWGNISFETAQFANAEGVPLYFGVAKTEEEEVKGTIEIEYYQNAIIFWVHNESGKALHSLSLSIKKNGSECGGSEDFESGGKKYIFVPSIGNNRSGIEEVSFSCTAKIDDREVDLLNWFATFIRLLADDTTITPVGVGFIDSPMEDQADHHGEASTPNVATVVTITSDPSEPASPNQEEEPETGVIHKTVRKDETEENNKGKESHEEETDELEDLQGQADTERENMTNRTEENMTNRTVQNAAETARPVEDAAADANEGNGQTYETGASRQGEGTAAAKETPYPGVRRIIYFLTGWMTFPVKMVLISVLEALWGGVLYGLL